MPEILFEGKALAKTYHKHLQHKTLSTLTDRRFDHQTSIYDNLIIEGDNLSVINTLLPYYRNRIKCIYIDPPYNTGNRHWVYKDDLSTPIVRDWVAKVIDNKSISKHDKWLCVMMPRLMLMKDLLSDEGLIFISIDDNEVHALKLLMDEIFGEQNFVAQIIVTVNRGGRDFNKIAKTHEYLLIYAKTQNFTINELEKANHTFKYHDKSGGFEIRELRNRNPKFGSFNRPNLYYPIYVKKSISSCFDESAKDVFYALSLDRASIDDVEVYPRNKAGKESCWRWGRDRLSESISDNLSMSKVLAKQKQGGGFNIYEKYRKSCRKVKSVWDDTAYRTEQGTKDLNNIGLKGAFEFPKPVELIKQILRIGADKNSIILDAFAGSGTTAQATLELNAEDKGKRKFILIECEKFIEDITVKRISTVIEKLASQGESNTFSIYKLS